MIVCIDVLRRPGFDPLWSLVLFNPRVLCGLRGVCSSLFTLFWGYKANVFVATQYCSRRQHIAHGESWNFYHINEVI